MNPMWEILWLHSWQYGCICFTLATAKKRFVRPPMVALLAIWLRLLSMLAKKNGCATSYGSAPGNMVASVNLATTKKNSCPTSYGCIR